MKSKLFLLLSTLLITLLGYISASAQGERVIKTAGNAYITSGSSAFIDERRNAIRRWDDTETVVSFYFRANECGKMDIALQAKGKMYRTSM